MLLVSYSAASQHPTSHWFQNMKVLIVGLSQKLTVNKIPHIEIQKMVIKNVLVLNLQISVLYFYDRTYPATNSSAWCLYLRLLLLVLLYSYYSQVWQHPKRSPQETFTDCYMNKSVKICKTIMEVDNSHQRWNPDNQSAHDNAAVGQIAQDLITERQTEPWFTAIILISHANSSLTAMQVLKWLTAIAYC